MSMIARRAVKRSALVAVITSRKHLLCARMVGLSVGLLVDVLSLLFLAHRAKFYCRNNISVTPRAITQKNMIKITTLYEKYSLNNDMDAMMLESSITIQALELQTL